MAWADLPAGKVVNTDEVDSILSKVTYLNLADIAKYMVWVSRSWSCVVSIPPRTASSANVVPCA